MTAAHTPGTWIADGQTVYALDETGNCNRFSVNVQGGWKWRGYSNIPAPSDRTPLEELQANTRLIAAAPDMLAALQAVRARFQHYRYGNDEEMVMDRVAAAIAKAKATPAIDALEGRDDR